MRTQTLFVLLGVAALLVGTTSVVAAQPGGSEGPPSDLPGVVPDFVSGLLESIQSFVAGVSDAIGALIGIVSPKEATVFSTIDSATEHINRA
ncbi:MAG: hypothetical protein V5A36_04960 [Natronomonas sp.]